MSGPSFDELIRAAAGRQVHEPNEADEKPVGRVGVGLGGAARAVSADPGDLINTQLRVALSVARGHVPLDLVIGNL